MVSIAREFSGECFDFDCLCATCLGGLVFVYSKERMCWLFFQLVLARVYLSKFRFGEGNG